MGMMTSSNGNIFRITGHLCGEFTGPGEFSAQRPVTRSFGVFFDLRLNNGWVNNREVGDLRRNHAQYNVNVMGWCQTFTVGPVDSCYTIVPSRCSLTRYMYMYYTQPCNYNDVIISAVASQIARASIVCSPFVQAQMKDNMKAQRHWPLWGEFIGDRWIPRTKGQYRGKCLHLMTSPCNG